MFSQNNTCNSDREGQAIIEDVLIFYGWRGPTERVLINDLNPEPIRKAFQQLEDNNLPKFQGMYRKAIARRHGDWLLGLNLTRLYTILGNKFDLGITLSAGRVQSAVLGLIVKRGIEIDQFTPHDYFVITGDAQASSGSFRVKWKAKEGQSGLDVEGRLIDAAIAETVKQKSPLACTVKDYDAKRKEQSPPLTFSMSDLQKTCSQKLGLTMQEVMEIAQKLYEKSGLITYPRSDTGYLPEDHQQEAAQVLDAIQENTGNTQTVQGADPSLKSRAFNDKKITAHHGIIPTAKASPSAITELSKTEKAVYDIVAERYAAQFYPPAIYLQTKVVLESGCGELFACTGRQYEKEGWRAITQIEDDEQTASDEDTQNEQIPPLNIGDQVQVADIEQQKKQTSPPKPYTDATLLGAMTGIHKHVKNAQVAQLLKACKGIGTVATQAGIIEKLVQHKLIQRKNKQFFATDVGETHYKLMPAEITEPDMAGLFEIKTQEVEKGDLSISAFLGILDQFVLAQTQATAQWEENAKKLGFAEKQRKASKPCRHCESPMKAVVSTKTKNKLYLCAACDSIYTNDSGNVGFCIKGPLNVTDEKARQERHNERLKDAPPCPECEAPILKVKPNSGKKAFWGCRACDSKFSDFAGKIGPIFVRRGESVQAEADGPACPDCENPMHRRTTAKKQAMLVCDHCQSMCWYDKGKPGKFFKRNGEMVASGTNA